MLKTLVVLILRLMRNPSCQTLVDVKKLVAYHLNAPIKLNREIFCSIFVKQLPARKKLRLSFFDVIQSTNPVIPDCELKQEVPALISTIGDALLI